MPLLVACCEIRAGMVLLFGKVNITIGSKKILQDSDMKYPCLYPF
jgi:hypothetical protein